MSRSVSFVFTTAHLINVLRFVFHIDILLLILFAVYVVMTLPRALVRLFQPSEFLNGLFLRSGASPASPERSNNARTLGRSVTTTKPDPVRSRSTRTNHTTEGDKAPETFEALVIPRARGSQKLHGPPTRVPYWTTIVHPTFAYALNFRVSPGFSFGKLLVLLTYAVIILYACLLRSDPFTDPGRTGCVAVSQIPVAVALAGKTNWLSWFCGVGYEKVSIDCTSPCCLYFSTFNVQLNYIHRFAGRVVVVTVNVHAVGYSVYFLIDHVAELILPHSLSMVFERNLARTAAYPQIRLGTRCNLRCRLVIYLYNFVYAEQYVYLILYGPCHLCYYLVACRKSFFKIPLIPNPDCLRRICTPPLLYPSY
jgi:Ferric reductase like transmembrane component